MRILLTGASGQVGGALAPRLEAFATVVGSDSKTLDFAQPASISAALDRLEPDVIVNAAAFTAVDAAEDEPDLAMAVNASAPGAIARWAAPRAVPLIHFSTDYVYGGEGDRPWREDDAPHPLNVYGATKLAGDVAILAAGGSPLILRTSWVYAAQGRNFLRTIAALARERRELRIVADQIGAPTSAVLVADAVAAIVGSGLPALRARSLQARGLVHLASTGETSWHGFACAIVEGLRARGVALGVERVLAIRSEEYPTRARRPRNSRLELSRLREVFGITPMPWRDALAPELDRLAAARDFPKPETQVPPGPQG
jgi:dTDP-4-dehydrorhamnose reductase